MKVKVEEVAGIELAKKHFVEIKFAYNERYKTVAAGVVIHKSSTKITFPLEKFSEQLMLETLKSTFKTDKRARKKIDKISKKILGKEYEV